MLFSSGLIAQEAQKTVELYAGSVNACYNVSDSYTSKISVRDFIGIKSFWIELKYDPSKFVYKNVTILQPSLDPLYTVADDNVGGVLTIAWTGTTSVTIGDNVKTDILGVTFGVAGGVNATANLFASALTWQSAQFWYSPTGGGSDEIRTTSLVGGTATVTVAYPTVQYTVTPATCDGGQANITVTSPVGAGYYYYFNGSTTSSTTPRATASAPSTNYVRVVDANGCSSHLITIPVTAPAPLTFTASTEAARCYGGNGEIQFNATGGTGPYTYYVIPYNGNTDELYYFQHELYYGNGKNSPELDQYRYTNFQVLKPGGTYWVTVDGASGCNTLIHPWWWGISSNTANPAWQLVTIDQPESAVGFTAQVTADITCNGSADGEITVSNPYGGTISSTADYTVSKDGVHFYAFENTEGYAPYIFSNLAAGTYTITVKDGIGCSTTTPVIVDQPTAIAFTLAYGDATCAGGATGSVTITSVSGGTAPYTYAVALTTAGMTGATWSSTLVQTTELTANYYSVWVKDANGCTKAFANQDGSGNILPIQAPGALAVTTSADNVAAYEVTCNGGSYTLTVTATGGTAPYIYSFDGGTTTTTSNTSFRSGLVTDTTVAVKVTDANSCPVDRLVTINVPVALTATVTTDPAVVAPTCPGGNDGRATVLASGGVAPYEYSTDGAIWFTNSSLAVPEGTTTITVRDFKGCITNTSVTVDALIASTLTATVTDINCHGAQTGTISVTTTWQGSRTVRYYVASTEAAVFTSGTAFTPVSINGGATTTPTYFVAGTYYLGARDEMGCKSSVISVTIREKAALAMTAVVTDATCFGLFDGTLTINTTGGFGQPQYAIANNVEALSSSTLVYQNVGTYSTTTSIGKQVVQVQRGTYYVKIKDACSNTSLIAGPFLVNGYKAITFTGTIAKTNITCSTLNDGTISVPVAGVKGGKPEFDGTGFYTFTLAKPAGGTVTNTTGAFTGLTNGTYTITISDASSCSSSTVLPVQVITRPSVVAITGVAVTHFSCVNSRDGRIAVTAAGGTPGYQLAVNASAAGVINPSDWLDFGTSTTTTTKTYIATEAGVYYLYVRDANHCMGSTVSVTVLQPAALTLTGVVTDVTCAGAGQVQLTPAGGWAPAVTQSYLFHNGTATNTTGLFTGLNAGTYTASVSVTAGSTSTSTSIVTYTYPVVSCTATYSYQVKDLVAYKYMAVTAPVKCKGGNDGSLTVTVLAGTAATVTTTGAEYYVQLTTTANPYLQAGTWTRTTNQKFTFTGLSHAIYSVWISNGNPTDYYQAPDYYCLIPSGTETPTDNVFTKSASWEVNEPATALAASVTWNKDVTCYGGSDGKFTVVASGGSLSYTYAAKLSTVSTGHVLTPEPAAAEFQSSAEFVKPIGTYVIWVKDSNGCIVGGEGTLANPVDAWRVQIRQPKQVKFALASTDVTCFGSATGKITVNKLETEAISDAVGGLVTYTITVTGVDASGAAVNITGTSTKTTGIVISGVPASVTYGSTSTNTYNVTVADANGCSNSATIAVMQNKAIDAKLVKAAGAFVCPGDVTGVVEAQVTGGTGAYTYKLYRDGVAYTTTFVDIPSFIVQIGHTWKVEVKDAASCSVFTPDQFIAEPVGVSATFSETTCYSDTKASVIIRATGEAGRTFLVRYRLNTTASFTDWAPFTTEYAIGNLTFANVVETQNFYYFEVKDDKGCVKAYTKSFVPTQHPLEVTMPVVTDLTASMTITGGISPYSYKIGTAAIVNLPVDNNTLQVVNLPAGQNTITVSDAHGCTFPVVVSVAPITVSAVPVAGATGLKSPFNVALTFNRDVTGVETSTVVTGGTGTPTITGSGKTYTVTVTGADMATITLALSNGIKDIAGNTLSATTFTYTVGDNTAPILLTWTPNGSTLVDNHPTLVMTFDENVVLGAGNVKIVKKSDNVTVVTIPVTAAMVSGKTATVTYVATATSGLDKNTDYYVLVDAGIVKDAAANGVAGVTATSTWTFKTGAAFVTEVPEIINNSLEFKVYPNPFVDYVTVTNASELSKVVVSNIAGQVVKEVVNPESTIQLNQLVSGVYFISLYQENVVIKTVKIVKR